MKGQSLRDTQWPFKGLEVVSRGKYSKLCGNHDQWDSPARRSCGRERVLARVKGSTALTCPPSCISCFHNFNILDIAHSPYGRGVREINRISLTMLCGAVQARAPAPARQVGSLPGTLSSTGISSFCSHDGHGSSSFFT